MYKKIMLLSVIIIIAFSPVLYSRYNSIVGTWKLDRQYDYPTRTNNYHKDAARGYYKNGKLVYLKNNSIVKSYSWSMNGNRLTVYKTNSKLVGTVTFYNNGTMQYHYFVYPGRREQIQYYTKAPISRYNGFNIIVGKYKVTVGNNTSYWYFYNNGRVLFGNNKRASYSLAGNLITFVYDGTGRTVAARFRINDRQITLWTNKKTFYLYKQ